MLRGPTCSVGGMIRPGMGSPSRVALCPRTTDPAEDGLPAGSGEGFQPGGSKPGGSKPAIYQPAEPGPPLNGPTIRDVTQPP
jgi:hypothetical protein